MRKTLFVAAAALVLAACDSTEPRVPAAVEVNPTSLNLQVGERVTVEAYVVDDRGRAFDTPPDGLTLAWSSADPSIARVNNGEITGVFTGQTTVSVQAGTLPAVQVQVNVDGRLQVTAGSFDMPIVSADDPDDREERGQMSFSFAGHRTGSFAVDETFNVRDGSGHFAAMEYNAQFRDQDFFAWHRRGDGLVDFMLFAVDAQTDTITAPGTVPAYFAEFWVGFNLDSQLAEAVYFIDVSGPTGTVEITAVSDDRIAGTFTMTLEADLLEGITNASLTSPGDVPTAAHGPQRDPRRDLRRDLIQELGERLLPR